MSLPLRTLLVFGPLLPFLAPTGVGAQDFYTDIRPILAANCAGCHGVEGPGWSMADAEDAYATRHAIAAAVLDRQMPPWIAAAGHRDYHDDPTLSEEILALVGEWREQGYPKGDPRPDPEPSPFVSNQGNGEGAHSVHGAFRPDLTLEVLPGGRYQPDQSRADDYRCFLAEWPVEESAYITGFRAVPGNRKIGHHVVIYAVSPEVTDRFQELEAEEAGPGYQCFGGALPDRLGDREVREAYEARYPEGLRTLNRENFWLAHWAPGMDGHRFPEGTGIRVEPGSAVVVQVHYYGSAAPGEWDEGTHLDFQIASQVERPAFHLPQTRNAWLSGERNRSMVIPPGEKATYQVTDRLEDLLPYIARVTGVEEDRVEALEVHSANLHMHAIGHSGVISLVDARGRKEILLEVPRWDLRWQRDFTFLEPLVFPKEELEETTITVECTFQNPNDGPVFGGLGSYDEMCFNFSFIAVREGDSVAEEDGPPE